MAILIPSLFFLLALIHLYHNWRIQPHSLFLSGAIASIGIVFVNYYLFIFGPSIFWLAVSYGHFTSLQMLMGPFLYFYVRGVLTDRHRISRRDLLHFTPALLDLVSRIPYFMVPWKTKLWMAEEMIREPNRLHDFATMFFPPTHVAVSLRLISMIGYTVYCLWMVRRFQGSRFGFSEVPKQAANTMLRFLNYMLAVCLVAELSSFTLQMMFLIKRNLTAGYIIGNPLLMLTFLGILSIPVIIQWHPEVLYGIPRWRHWKEDNALPEKGSVPLASVQESPVSDTNHGSEEWHETSSADDAHFQALADRIRRTMEEEKPFLDASFSLDDLARTMEIPKHHLYYCFSKILQTRFTRFRAEHRIKHACMLMDAGASNEKTLEGIGLESGFSNRVSFAATFREIMGTTPREYLRRKNQSSPSL